MTSSSRPVDIFDRLIGELAEAWRRAREGDPKLRPDVIYAVAADHLRKLRRHPDVARDDRLTDRLAEELEILEDDARVTFRIGGVAPPRLAYLLPLLRVRGRALRRTARYAAGLAPPDEVPYILAEAQAVESGLDLDADTEDHVWSGIRATIQASRRSILRAVVERQLDEVRRLDAEAFFDAGRGWTLYRRLEEGRRWLDGGVGGTNGDATDIDPDEAALRDRLKQASQSIESRIVEFVAAARSVDQHRVARRVWSRLTDEIEEHRLRAMERSETDLESLIRLEDLARRFDGALREALRSSDADVVATSGLRRADRRLRRLIRRIADLRSDLILRRRLDRVFGPRMVVVWEAIVFWLIINVLALIVADHYRDPDPEGVIGWTTWADTAICGILLLDFFTRTFLSPRRLRYFFRHFLTEFVPSIPFGLLANLHAFGYLPAVRALRLGRVVRILRIARPLIRLFRLFLFMMRALDRMVERNAWFLDRNIVFRGEDDHGEGLPPLLKRARDIDGWLDRTTVRLYRDLPPLPRGVAARVWVGLIEKDLPSVAIVPEKSTATTGFSRLQMQELDADDVIASLRGLDDAQVADVLGLEFATQVVRMLRFLRLPLLRRVPVVRFVVGPDGAPDPLWMTARVGRVFGDWLAFVKRTINWFADLYGVITGAQVLDRVGNQLVRATARPAKRLLLIGAIVLAVLLFVKVINLPWLEPVEKAVTDLFAISLVIIGVVCFIPLVLGLWLRRIAGQAVDFYERVAEAQFLALTEVVKEQNTAQHLRRVAQRVMVPEAFLSERRSIVEDEAVVATYADFATQELTEDLDSEGARFHLTRPQEDDVVRRRNIDFVLLFYRDFLDGAYFHANDTKIASLLLGNLTLENIRGNRLRYDKKAMKRLERLDIARGKGGFSGPFMWFNFITRSIAQQTARLVIEYNQHCIPVDEIESADPVDRKLYDDWLARRHRFAEIMEQGGEIEAPPPAELAGTDGTLVYRTTGFNALHFLIPDPKRDAAVAARYGEEVASLLHQDRVNLIREIFGTFPLEELDVRHRTVNPYELYRRYLSRGRVFLMPLTMVLVVFRLLRLLARRFFAVVKDVLDPSRRPVKGTANFGRFDVARRKIHRMRRPVVLEAMQLRAEFDVEYLGLTLPGLPPSVAPGLRVADDLRRINASEREWQFFRELKSRREGQLRILVRILRSFDTIGDGLETTIRDRNPALTGREPEAIRAFAIAFCCDHADAWSIADAHDSLVRLLDDSEPKGDEPEDASPRLRRRKARRFRELFDRVWPTLSRPGLDLEIRERLLDDPTLRSRAMLQHMETLDRLAPKVGDPRRRVLESLLEVAEQPSSWTEQIMAIRTVQALAMTDLEGYEDLVRRLGEYEDDAEDARAESAALDV